MLMTIVCVTAIALALLYQIFLVTLGTIPALRRKIMDADLFYREEQARGVLQPLPMKMKRSYKDRARSYHHYLGV